MDMMPFTGDAILCSTVNPKLHCNEIWKSFMMVSMEQLGNKIASDIQC